MSSNTKGGLVIEYFGTVVGHVDGPNVPVRRAKPKAQLDAFDAERDIMEAEEELERERAIYRQQASELNKPEPVLEKIVAGKMERFYEEACLMEQAFIKEPARRVKDLIQDSVARLGENIRVRRFVRYSVGEGMKDQGTSPG